jgi:hypothetical protein
VLGLVEGPGCRVVGPTLPLGGLLGLLAGLVASCRGRAGPAVGRLLDPPGASRSAMANGLVALGLLGDHSDLLELQFGLAGCGRRFRCSGCGRLDGVAFRS